jgi:hypothetical protein
MGGAAKTQHKSYANIICHNTVGKISPNGIRMIKLRKQGHMTRIGEKRNEYGDFSSVT